MKQELKITNDGSHTLYVSGLDEHYHSVNGAYNESMFVFIDKGLRLIEQKKIKVLEVGFGTALNAFLTAVEAKALNKTIQYYGIEKYPVSPTLVSEFNFAQQLGLSKTLFMKMHECEWGKTIALTENFNLHKIKADIYSFELNEKVNLIYFDAFAPEKQPKMWTEDVFMRMYKILEPGGILVTYCAKGVVRRIMQAVGFSVERLEGPPGKREMLRARKIAS